MRVRSGFLLLLLLLPLSLLSQRGIGFRFGADFNHFFRGDDYAVIDGSWSNVVVGPYYQAYFSNGGFQLGLNFLYKNATDKGWPNLPLVQRDFNGPHNVGLTGAELDLRVGPRFKWFNPQIGYRMSYRWKLSGMVEPNRNFDINALNIGLPFIGKVELPTEWGSVGFSAGYTIGITNSLRNPQPGTPGWQGSHQNSIDFELFMLFMAGKQKPK